MTAARGSLAESLMKTATWYLSDSVLTGIVSFIVTRDVTTAFSIALLQQTTELLLYFFHERVWVKVQARRGAK